MSQVVALFDATPHEHRLLAQSAGALGQVEVAPHPVRGMLHEARVAIVFSFADLPTDVWEDAPKLEWIVSLPAGANHVPFDALPPQARVVSLHGPNARALAEHAFALMLGAAKRLITDARALSAGHFDQDRTSKPLDRATLLVIGAGAIGSEVLQRGRAFRMWRFAVNRTGRPHPDADETLTPARLPETLARADFIVLSLPLTGATRGLIDAKMLAHMKKDAVLVNVARGAIVDRTALAAHLAANPEFTYATDVWWRYPKEGEAFDEPLLALPNFIGTPHAAALVPDWREKMVAAAARVLADIATEGEPDLGSGSPAHVEVRDGAA